MQSLSAFDQANDLPAFSFGLDTPSKFLNSTSPTPWSLGSGLTPSLFASLGSRGFTPSLSGPNAPNAGEPNPFELSLSSSAASSKRHSVATGMDEVRLPGEADFDFSAAMMSGAGGGRKRAMSSPALGTPGGSGFPFLAPSAAQPPDALANFALKPAAKRPRMDSMASSSNESTVDKIFSDTDKRGDSASPASSAVPSPANPSTALPPIKENIALDIDVSAPPALLNASAPASTSTLFSQLAEQRSALLARGPAAYSQVNPLPMKSLDGSVVKPEPTDDAGLPASPPAPRPISTRSSSKRGKAPSFSFASTSANAEASTSASPAPAPTPKRKGGRRKSTSTASSAAGKSKKDGEETQPAEEEDEESVKRKQFLERNRVAACKSRQKKKERVGQLEKLAGDLCQRNQLLQQTALALRNEALALRQLMLAHNGCNCEHAQGYIARDAAGGGISTIDQLAGRTLTLDYSIAPSMGTDDDVYSFLDRGEPGPVPISQLDPLGQGTGFSASQAAAGAAYLASLASSATGAMPPGASAIPINPIAIKTRVPSEPTGMLVGASPVSTNCGGMTTRRSSAAAAASQNPLAVPKTAIPFTSLAPSGLNPLAIAPAGLGHHQQQASFMGDIPVVGGLRSTSAPPTTPSWDAPQPRGDYFAEKTSVQVVAA